MWFWFFLISLSINVLLLFYVRWMIKILAVANEDTNNLMIIINDFSNHLKSIHELEMFYGDENLKALIEHSKLVIENVESMDLVLQNEEQESEETKTQEN